MVVHEPPVALGQVQGNGMQLQPREEARTEWHSAPAFFCAAAACSSGIATAFRLPWVLALHGGGAFFIPYLLALLLVGWPLALLELAVGQLFGAQRSAAAALSAFGAASAGAGNKLGRGAGVGSLWIAAAACWCYSPVLSYAAILLTESVVSSDLRWAGGDGVTAPPNATALHRLFEDQVAQQHSTRSLSTRTVVGLIAVWLALFALICTGLRGAQRIALVALPLWVVVLVSLFTRALSLGHAGKGFSDLLNPRVDLWDVEVWADAVSHAVLSSSAGCAVLLAFGSFNPPQRDIVKYSLWLLAGSALSALLSGVGTFGVLAWLADAGNGAQLGDHPDRTGSASDAMLAPGYRVGYRTTLEVYAAAVSSLQGSWTAHAFGAVLFLACLLLGLDTLHALSLALIAALHDLFPSAAARRRGWLLSLAACVFVCLGAVPFALSDRGYDLMSAVDRLLVRFALPMAALVEVLLVGWGGEEKTLRQRIHEREPEQRTCGWLFQCLQFSVGRLTGPVQMLSRRRSKQRQRGLQLTGKYRFPGMWSLCIKVISPILLVVALSTAAVAEVRDRGRQSGVILVIAASAPVVYLLILIAFVACGTDVSDPGDRRENVWAASDAPAVMPQALANVPAVVSQSQLEHGRASPSSGSDELGHARGDPARVTPSAHSQVPLSDFGRREEKGAAAPRSPSRPPSQPPASFSTDFGLRAAGMAEGSCGQPV